MPDETTPRAESDQSDQTAPAEEVSSLTAPLSQEAGEPRRVRVRVGRDGTAVVGHKSVEFGRSLAGALVTVEEPR